jgi:hypothetical protein
MSYNTRPNEYVVDLRGLVRLIPEGDYTASKRVVLALMAADCRVAATGFRKAVTNAIFDDVVEQNYPDENYRNKLIRRLDKWTSDKSRKVFLARCEILECWINRDSRFIPDAFIVDCERRTVVCYEIEDSHPLSPFSIGEYGAAWWTLEYIYWDLHLIAYDIYGNSRVIDFPESDFLAHEERMKRKPPPV